MHLHPNKLSLSHKNILVVVSLLKVRRSACHALQMLTVLSAEFAGGAVHILMDILNDDSVVVRLQALETLHHMAMHDHLKVEESHLHMVNSQSM